jgi:hypothetical protein
MHKRNVLVLVVILLIVHVRTQAQESKKENSILFSGKIQTDVLLPQTDTTINTGVYNSKVLSNTYGDVGLQSKYVDAGLRFEMYEKPLPGFGAEYTGFGIPFYYVKAKYNKLQLTLGNFYEQFGSGLIFRTYEERSLGLDNSLRGGLLTFRANGIRMKALAGYQRYYWEYSKSSICGVDAEIDLDEWIEKLKSNNVRLQYGASFVSKYQQTEVIMASLTEKLHLPEKVGAFASRLRYQQGKVSLMTEYAIKANDPSADNNYIYKNASAFLVSGSYSQKGLGVLLQAKRSDNMGFRSQRTERGRMLVINHLPSFTKQHTFVLAALYPYATQQDGEVALQAEITYNFKKGTSIGGKSGMDVKANFSRVHSIDKKFANGDTTAVMGTYGYTSNFFRI